MTPQKQIDQIMDRFDFEKVKKVMDYLRWGYWNDDTKAPEIFTLRQTARYLLNHCVEEGHGSCNSTGGFTAENYLGVLELRFVIEEFTALVDEET